MSPAPCKQASKRASEQKLASKQASERTKIFKQSYDRTIERANEQAISLNVQKSGVIANQNLRSPRAPADGTFDPLGNMFRVYRFWH